MSKLEVKTRRNSSPQGKARVYFSCHPDDLAKYLDPLADDIFETQNCALYYVGDAGAEADPKELREQLSDMQLFIVPLTKKYLTQASGARDFEYSLAHELHTPIIPIAVEPGLDSLFPEIMNRIGEGFGDIQFLDRTSQDATAISYKEKLKSRLESILVGDELAKRVRAAFDAYIFLSYRKKDRSYAKELMSLIHRIPYCRDIAIWYDEFLVPGEGWSDAIAEAMAKSAMVVLAVTPNLTEAGNFVITHEYPDAVGKGKDIIPAELLPTDIEALRRLFPGIADTVDGTDVEAVSSALQVELQKLALTGNDGDPEHNYLIGLAYLGGIDVERDPQKAAELIRQAADADLPEAVEKLAAMYHDGDGVERSYAEEIIWLERLTEARKRIYEENETEKAWDELIFAVWDLGAALCKMRKLDQAKDVFEQMKEYSEQGYHRYSDQQARIFSSVSCNELGYILKLQGKYFEAEEYYLSGLKIREVMAKETGTAEARRDLLGNYLNLGDIARIKLNFNKAEEYYRNGLKIAEELEEETGTALSRSDLSVSYNKLGDIAMKRRKPAEAEKYYLSGLKIREALEKERDTIEARSYLSFSYERLGDALRKQGRLSEAKEYYRRELDICEEVAGETETVGANEDLGISCYKMGGICCETGDIEAGIDYMNRAVEIYERLMSETGNTHYSGKLQTMRKELKKMQKRTTGFFHRRRR